MAVYMDFLNRMVWGLPALVLILGVGLLLSFRTGFAQILFLPKAMKLFFSKMRRGNSGEGISPFQALCTALAATVGTGNLVGVAGAIALGGPGSIFWMWVCAILGMVTKFAEATLAVRYRVKEAGEYVGGPMYIISRGLGRKWSWLASTYSFFGIFAAFGVGNATQINACVAGIGQVIGSFGGEMTAGAELAIGVLLAILVGAMLLGGAKRIGKAAELLVPFVSGAYILLCLFVLLARMDRIPDAVSAIVRGAFCPEAVTGGMLGSVFATLRTGVARGVFTNEAGMGTASIAHASAQVEHPAEQGLMGIMEVFLDTIVICTMTALVILVSGVPISYGKDVGGQLTADAFSAVCGSWVNVFLAAALCCFAFATVLGWGLYGARCAQYLFGNGAWKHFALFQTVAVLVGALLETGTIWSLAETVNGLMAIPNLIALVMLSGELGKLTFEYKTICGRRAAGGTYENLDQRKPLSALSYEKIPSLRTGSKKTG